MYCTLDIGGTNTRIAYFPSLETPSYLKRICLPTVNNYQKDKEQIITAIRQVSSTPIRGIGISIAGVMDDQKSRITASGNLSSWTDRPIKQDLQDTFNCTVCLENDATAAALGEAYAGKNLGKDLLYVIWGTGIGATFVRWIHEKAYLRASELGHQIIQWDGPLCPCGQKGCLELYCGGTGITRLYGKQAQNLSEDQWKEVELYFARGLINALLIHPVGTIVLSGGIALNQEKRLIHIQQIISENLKVFPVPTISLSSYGDDCGIYGALYVVKRELSLIK